MTQVKNTLIFFSILLAITGCGKKNTGEATKNVFRPIPDSTIEVTVKNVSGNILYPGNIFISGDKLIVLQQDMDTLFYVFQLPEVEFLYSFGTKGEAPNEFSNIYNESIIPTKEGFKLYCANNTINEISLKERAIIKKEHISSDYDLFNGFQAINDSLYCFYNMTNPDFQFVLYNSHTQETTAFGEYPQWTSDEAYETNHISKVIDCLSHVVVKEDQSTLAAFYGYFDCFRTFDCLGNHKETYLIEPSSEKYILNNDINQRTIYFPYPPQTINDYIYCIYRNATSTDEQTDLLQIWKWDGSPVASYKLEHNISSFCISDEYKKIYAVSTKECNEDKIFIYDLPYY